MTGPTSWLDANLDLRRRRDAMDRIKKRQEQERQAQEATERDATKRACPWAAADAYRL